MTAFLFWITFLFSQSAWAFKLSLTESTLELGQGMFSTTATVINDGKSMIAIEAGARKRAYSPDGVENFDAEAESLVIVPGQMIVPPEGEQVLTIRWTGPKNISTEKAYRLLIEYVPVSEKQLLGLAPDEQKAGININYRIAKSFYVNPKGTKPNIEVRKAQVIDQEGKKKLKLSFENIGSKHQIVTSINLQLSTASNRTVDVMLDKEALGGGTNFLALEKRSFTIDCPENLSNNETLSATILGFDQ